MEMEQPDAVGSCGIPALEARPKDSQPFVESPMSFDHDATSGPSSPKMRTYPAAATTTITTPSPQNRNRKQPRIPKIRFYVSRLDSPKKFKVVNFPPDATELSDLLETVARKFGLLQDVGTAQLWMRRKGSKDAGDVSEDSDDDDALVGFGKVAMIDDPGDIREDDDLIFCTRQMKAVQKQKRDEQRRLKQQEQDQRRQQQQKTKERENEHHEKEPQEEKQSRKKQRHHDHRTLPALQRTPASSGASAASSSFTTRLPNQISIPSSSRPSATHTHLRQDNDDESHLRQDNDDESVYYSLRGGSDNDDVAAFGGDTSDNDNHAVDSSKDDESSDSDDELRITIRPKNTTTRRTIPPATKNKVKPTTELQTHALRKSPRRSAGAEKRNQAVTRKKTSIPNMASQRPRTSQGDSEEEEQVKEKEIPVGSRWFVLNEGDGYEYPVQVMPRTLSSDEDDNASDNEEKCQIEFHQYADKELIGVSKLLPWTPERENTYNDMVVPSLKMRELEEATPEPTVVEDPQVNSTYFHKYHKDGNEYPVKLLKLFSPASSKSKNAAPEGKIKYEIYGTQRKVPLSELLPSTPRRREKFEVLKANDRRERINKASRSARTTTTKQSAKKKKCVSSKACTPPKTTICAPKKRKAAPASDTAEVDDGSESEDQDIQPADDDDIDFGPATDTSDLPTSLDVVKVKEGTMWTQAKRHIYFSKNNETPACIAKKANLPLEKLLYDNRRKYRKLEASKKLQPKTPIVLPLYWSTKDVATGIKSVNSTFLHSSDKKSSSNGPPPKSRNKRNRIADELISTPSPKIALVIKPATKKVAPKKVPAKKRANGESDDDNFVHDEKYEPATDISNLPTEEDRHNGNVQEPGTSKLEKKRTLYFTRKNETIQAIANKFAIDVEKVIYDNRREWGSNLGASSRCLKGTPIVLPSNWNGSSVRLQQSERSIPPRETGTLPDNIEIASPSFSPADLPPPTEGVPAAAAAPAAAGDEDYSLCGRWLDDYNLHTSL